METASTNAGQPAEMSERFARRLLATGETRCELLMLEVQEEHERLLQHLSSAEGRSKLEILSRADVGPTMVKLFPNCRTENIKGRFGPPLPANSDGIRYRFKIRTEQAASRTNGEVLGTGGNNKEPKARNQRCSAAVFRTNRVRYLSVGR